MRQKHLALILALSLLALSSACGINPVTGKRELTLVSPQREISIGQQNYLPTQQVQGGAYLIDQSLKDYVTAVGKRLAQVSDRPKLPYEFVIINNSVPNAWALPGGKIAINRGLLLELKNEAELASVLAHEIVHAAARHGAKSMERGILLSAGVAGIGLATQGKDISDLIIGAASIGSGLINSQYGRSA